MKIYDFVKILTYVGLVIKRSRSSTKLLNKPEQGSIDINTIPKRPPGDQMD